MKVEISGSIAQLFSLRCPFSATICLTRHRRWLRVFWWKLIHLSAAWDLLVDRAKREPHAKNRIFNMLQFKKFEMLLKKVLYLFTHILLHAFPVTLAFRRHSCVGITFAFCVILAFRRHSWVSLHSCATRYWAMMGRIFLGFFSRKLGNWAL